MDFDKVKKVAMRSLKILTLVLVLAAMYVCFIPPFGQLPRADNFGVIKVEPAQNAFTSYELALKALEESKKSFPRFNHLPHDKLIKGLEPLNEESHQWLELNKKTITYLLEGAKASKFQFYNRIPSSSDGTINFVSSRELFNLANLQTRALIEEGKLEQATQIALAAYKMASYLNTDPNSGLLFPLVSEICRDIMVKVLFDLINQDNIKADTLIIIAKEIQEADSKVGRPYEVMLREWRISQISLDNTLIGEVEEKKDEYLKKYLKTNYLPSALKQRLYKSLMEKIQTDIFLLSVPLKQWDFSATKAAEKLSDELSESVFDNFLRDIFQSHARSMMRMLYFGQVSGAGLRALAICDAYKKINGRFPDSLEQAFEQMREKADLRTPIDPITKKTVSYRLQDEKPVVWLVGVDGQDDGGINNYIKNQTNMYPEGQDLIFFYKEKPTWLN